MGKAGGAVCNVAYRSPAAAPVFTTVLLPTIDFGGQVSPVFMSAPFCAMHYYSLFLEEQGMSENSFTIESVMSVMPHTIGPEQTLQTAKEMMRKYGIRHLPVQKGGQLLGVISHRDLNFALAVDRKDASHMIVDEVYSQEPYVVEPNTSVAEVADRMARDGIGCALVVKDGHICGIFTTVDACRVLATILKDEQESA